jgi:hypothetical protein
MAEATDIQMQRYCDERIRPFAEAARALLAAAQDHAGAIDDAYARATGEDRWNDARTDGPPHLLQSGNSANPDDMLNFNTFLARLADFFAGTLTDGNKNEGGGCWAVLRDACVRPLNG